MILLFSLKLECTLLLVAKVTNAYYKKIQVRCKINRQLVLMCPARLHSAWALLVHQADRESALK